MYNLHLKKKRENSEEIIRNKHLAFEVYKDKREAFKNEAKVINQGKRNEWVQKVLKSNKK